MENGTMFAFLKVLFLGTWVTITQTPIDIGTTPVKIKLDEPISAITSGAHIRIDITSYIKSSNVITQLDEAEKFMPSSCLTAELTSSDGKIHLLDDLYQSVGNDSTELVLTKKGGVPTGIEFTTVILNSCKPIEGTVIKWANYKM